MQAHCMENILKIIEGGSVEGSANKALVLEPVTKLIRYLIFEFIVFLIRELVIIYDSF